jgi:hypothetical protein
MLAFLRTLRGQGALATAGRMPALHLPEDGGATVTAGWRRYAYCSVAALRLLFAPACTITLVTFVIENEGL